MQAIILSGGKGTRLYPMTIHTPKPMLHIGGKPHLEHQINLLKKHGITDIIFSTGYLHDEIVNYFGDGSKFGVKIQYVQDGEEPLGTAGAIKNCFSLAQENHYPYIIVLNGDILTDINITALVEKHHSNKSCPITIALTNVDDSSSYGVSVMNGDKITKFIEKPSDKSYGNKINSGIYVFDFDVLLSVPDGFSMVEQDLFPKFAENGMVQGFVDDYYWLDIGTLDRYLQAHKDIYDKKIDIRDSKKIDYNFYKMREDEFVVGTWWGKLGTEVTFSSIRELANLIAYYSKKFDLKKIMISPDSSEYSMEFADIIADIVEDVGVEIGDYDGDCPVISITSFFGEAHEEEKGFKYITLISKNSHIINYIKRKSIKKIKN